MLISEIISLKVVSIWNKNFEGIVENALFESKTNKLKYLKIYNEKDNFTYYLKPCDIYKLSPTTILIKNNTVLNPIQNLELCTKSCFNPIGATLYDFDGNEQGIITDLSVTNNFVLEYIFINSVKFKTEKIFIFGENISFLKPEKNIKISNFSPKKRISINKKNIKVESLETQKNEIENNSYLTTGTNTETLNNTTIESNLKKTTSLTSPKRIITDYRFLINRILIENITLSNGEILIRKNSRINSLIIEKARTFGKLIELTQKSK